MPYKDPEKQRAYNNEWTRKRALRLREELDAIKVERGCVDCGYNADARALEWDHIIPRGGNHVPTVSRLMAHGRRRVMEEIEKCEVRCANCHRIKTYQAGEHRKTA